MKKLTGITLMFLLAAFTLQVNAQSNAEANVFDKSGKKNTKADKAEETTGTKPVKSKPDDVTINKPVPNTGTTAPAPRPKTKTDAGIVKPIPKPNTEVSEIPVQESGQPVKGPSREKRMHAEERSNGNAFSGRGNGGDKNLVDPIKKDKKDKKVKDKKNKKK